MSGHPSIVATKLLQKGFHCSKWKMYWICNNCDFNNETSLLERQFHCDAISVTNSELGIFKILSHMS